MSFRDGYLNGIDSYISDAQSVVSQLEEIVVQAMDEADCITNEGAILATVKDGVMGCLNEIQQLIREL